MKRLIAFALLACLVVSIEAAKIKVEAQPDPTFDFSSVHTWAWDAEAGDVIMARTASDDPAPVKARVDPLIRKYVEAAMAKKGLTLATSGTPDFQMHYYVLVTVNTSGQYMGQFLPAVPYWGLPPFAPATTSLKIVTRGSIVLDAMLPAAKASDRRVIWRGIAQSTVGDGDSESVRDARIREASEGLVAKFPLTKPKAKK